MGKHGLQTEGVKWTRFVVSETLENPVSVFVSTGLYPEFGSNKRLSMSLPQAISYALRRILMKLFQG